MCLISRKYINNQEFFDLSKVYLFIIDNMLDYAYKYKLDIPFNDAELFKLQDLLLNVHIIECQEKYNNDKYIASTSIASWSNKILTKSSEVK